MKRSIISTGQETVFGSYPSGTSNDYVYFPSGDQLGFFGSISGSQSVYLLTTRVFRDVSAWSHIVIAVDTTQSTAADRVKIYVNGTQETAFDQSSYPAQNVEFRLAKASNVQEIGTINNGSHFDGLLTHFHFIDGTQYAATDFGETDSTSGIWKPKTSPSVTYGSNGFFLKFENSGAMGTDSSGNSNTFTVNGTLTQNVDTPSNNFATLNPLNPSAGTLSNGNLTLTASTSPEATFGVSSGKWYWETKLITQISSEQIIGVCNETFSNSGSSIGSDSNAWGYIIQSNSNNGQAYHNGSTTQYSTFTTNDILIIALDMDNQAIYFGKNGTWQNSGDPTSGSSKTGAIYTNLPTSGFIFPCFRTTSSGVISANFGSGFFGTTAVASANADGNGFGAFEYAVPSGYYALCTKNIKEFG
jgi:hypothetical protein